MAFFFVRLIPNRKDFPANLSADEGAAMQRHALFLREQLQAKTLVVAGPVMDPNGVFGLGVFKGESVDAVRALLEKDPAQAVGRYEVRRAPHLGSVLGRRRHRHSCRRFGQIARPGALADTCIPPFDERLPPDDMWSVALRGSVAIFVLVAVATVTAVLRARRFLVEDALALGVDAHALARDVATESRRVEKKPEPLYLRLH
jgi:uncharacterized protein YciI